MPAQRAEKRWESGLIFCKSAVSPLLLDFVPCCVNASCHEPMMPAGICLARHRIRQKIQMPRFFKQGLEKYCKIRKKGIKYVLEFCEYIFERENVLRRSFSHRFKEDVAMPTITAGDFRNGVTFEMDGKIMTVVEFQHVKPGKGAAFVRTKMKNIVTGAVTETSFNPTAKFEQAFVERRDAEYSYNDGDLYYFMDPETFDMTPLNSDVLGDGFKFVKENTTCKLLSYKGNVFGIEVPNFMDLEVTETEPGVRGDTATNVTKPATLETGAEIKVPLFINTGDKITVDTRTGEYLSRCKD